MRGNEANATSSASARAQGKDCCPHFHEVHSTSGTSVCVGQGHAEEDYNVSFTLKDTHCWVIEKICIRVIPREDQCLPQFEAEMVGLACRKSSLGMYPHVPGVSEDGKTGIGARRRQITTLGG